MNSSTLALIFIGVIQVSSATAQPILDELADSRGWAGPTTTYGQNVGTAWFDSKDYGNLIIRRDASVYSDAVIMRKDYQKLNFPTDTWVHIRWKRDTTQNAAYGQNTFFGSNMNIILKLNGTTFANFNFNGAAHWKQFVSSCTPKSSYDDELVLGMLASSGWLNDQRVAYPVQFLPAMSDAALATIYTSAFVDTKNYYVGSSVGGIAGLKHYSDWHILSVKFHLDSPDWSQRKLFFYIDGRLILPCNIDSDTGGQWDPKTTLTPRTGANNTLSVELSTFADAAWQRAGSGTWDTHYYYYNNYRGTACGIWNAPGRPEAFGRHSAGTSLSSYDNFDFIMIGQGYSFDPTAIANLLWQGRVGGVASAVFTEMIGWRDAQTWCPWMSSDEINEVRHSPYGSASFCSTP